MVDHRLCFVGKNCQIAGKGCTCSGCDKCRRKLTYRSEGRPCYRQRFAPNQEIIYDYMCEECCSSCVEYPTVSMMITDLKEIPQVVEKFYQDERSRMEEAGLDPSSEDCVRVR